MFDPEIDAVEASVSPQEALQKAMERSKTLPSTKEKFASNHIMVNQERLQRTIAPLTRLRELDEIARFHAEEMASESRLFHLDPAELNAAFNRPKRRLGANVAKGESVQDIHLGMMSTTSNKNNILDRRFSNMGMATSRAGNGELYLCQIFRG